MSDDTTELATRPDEYLDAVERDSGWLWCHTAGGDGGWVPERTLAPIRS